MALNEQVIVLGEDTGAVPRPPEPTETSRSPLRVVAPVFAVLVALIALFVIPQDNRATTVDPGELEAPEEPLSAFVTPNDESDPGSHQMSVVDMSGTGVVSSIDHGPDGWLAVSSGAAVVAHMSEDAVLWEPSTIHGMIGEQPVAAVGHGVLAVVGSNRYPVRDGPLQIGAISADFGDSWTPISHAGPILVKDVQIIDDRVFVAGAIGDELGSDIEIFGSAAMWEVVDGLLRPIELTGAGSPSVVTSIVETDGGVMAYGSTEFRPARWSMEGERQQLTVPREQSTYRFVSVKRTDEALVALVGAVGTRGGTLIWVSEDGSQWSEPNEFSIRMVVDIAVTDAGDLIGPITDGSQVWFGGREVVGIRRLTGEDAPAWVTSVESADGITTLGGGDGAGPALFVQGAPVHPVEVAPAMPGDTPQWRSELTIGVGVRWAGDTAHLLGSMHLGDTIFFATTTRLFEVDATGGLLVTPWVEEPEAFGYTNAGVWVLSTGPDGQMELDVREQSRSWRALASPLRQIYGVGWVDGVLTVTGSESGGFSTYQLSADGQWLEMADPAGGARPSFPMGDGLVTFDDSGAVFSPDGSSRRPIDGWTVWWPQFGGQPFLRSLDDPAVVANPRTLPDLTGFVLPTSVKDVRLWPWGERAIVQDPWTLHIPDGPGWRSIPIDVEHGVTGEAIALPGDLPRLVMIDGGLLSFLVWG